MLLKKDFFLNSDSKLILIIINRGEKFFQGIISK